MPFISPRVSAVTPPRCRLYLAGRVVASWQLRSRESRTHPGKPSDDRGTRGRRPLARACTQCRRPSCRHVKSALTTAAPWNSPAWAPVHRTRSKSHDDAGFVRGC
ncbi:hypothetical protein HPB50_013112 [Hyalomma asiaticum]|uniref:Uncharacterized protein n=1 Tax=Hyalomma asiaticum TaxID=266040 RepID=A0ACB7S6L8_HYAAI|nr:hypothetical protein HPB50_013112 [Hyalomma asiaticum]